jgi:hypothetical protein
MEVVGRKGEPNGVWGWRTEFLDQSLYNGKSVDLHLKDLLVHWRKTMTDI